MNELYIDEDQKKKKTTANCAGKLCCYNGKQLLFQMKFKTF